MKYTCNACKMEIQDIICNKCHEPLKPHTIHKNDKDITAVKCKKCEGMIKAPFCCGKDMVYS